MRIWPATHGTGPFPGTQTLVAPLSNAPNVYSKTGLFNPWDFTAQILLHYAHFAGTCPNGCYYKGLQGTELATKFGHPCAIVTFVVTFM
jgi:hypothetical protein